MDDWFDISFKRGQWMKVEKGAETTLTITVGAATREERIRLAEDMIALWRDYRESQMKQE